MRVNHFSLLIPEGRERDSGHVELVHGTVYTLKLGNHDHSRRCDAMVQVDGKEIGTFRVAPGGYVTLERSPNDHGRFTFFLADSPEGQAAQAHSVCTEDRGLLIVTFRPERRPVYPVGEVKTSGGMPKSTWISPRTYSGGSSQSHGFVERGTGGQMSSFAPDQAAAGVTGLTGHSGQQFYNVAALDYDPAGEVIIHLRLVGVAAVRPLQPMTNPVPRVVE